MSQDFSKAELDRVLYKHTGPREGTRINDSPSHDPHPDNQTEEGHRRARLSRGLDNMKLRLEFLQFGEELGWPKLPYGKPQNSTGVFRRGASVKSSQKAWEEFAQHAHFSRLAPALRNARVRAEYMRAPALSLTFPVGDLSVVFNDPASVGMTRTELPVPERWEAEAPKRYANLEKARAARAAKKAMKEII